MQDVKKYAIPVLLVFVVTILIGLIFTKPTTHSDSKHSEESDMNHSGNYVIDITSDEKSIQPGILNRITFKIKDENEETLKNFEIVHEKILHVIIVRKDLQGFQHIHPDLNSSTGEFTVDVSFDKPGPYVMYADFTPATFEENAQKMPSYASHDISVGNINEYNAETVSLSTSNTITSGDYESTYTIDPPTEKGLRYILSIKKEGQDVKDLQPYLGAMGHSVLLNAQTMEYIHTHAGEMNERASAIDVQKMSRGPNLFFSTMPLEKGIYKAFTQFQHNNKVITSEYVFEVK